MTSRGAAAPELSILLPATSQPGRLAEALDALAERLPGRPASEIVVVLNAATSEVRAVVGARREPLVVVDSEVNLGVTGGYNRARLAARGRLLALLHDDTRIEPGWLEELLAVLAAHPEAGAVSSLVLHPDGAIQSAGSLLWREGWTTVPWPLDGAPAAADLGEVEPIDYGGTCATLVRAEVFDTVGGFDEALHPGYYADVDLCLGIRAAGRTVLLAPRSRAVHERGSSTTPRFREFLTLRNRERIRSKWADALAARPAVDLTPAGYAAARARVRREAEAIAAGFAAAPRRLAARFRCDPDEQAARLARLEAEVATAYRLWEATGVVTPAAAPLTSP